jgi:gliding motility-associated-like protein
MMKKYYLLTFIVFLAGFFSAKAQTANFTFSPQSGCDIITVNFYDASTGASSWLWKSNGNQFSTLQNPSFIFTTGTYVISLEINGGVSTAYDTVHVYQSPSASFSTVSDTTCAGVSTVFTDTSTAGSGAIAYYIWTWGDGGGDTVFTGTASHVYTVPGVYSANLVIYDVNGCHSQSVPHTIHVQPAPNVSFTMSSSSGCTPPDTVNFTNTSNPTAATYSWTFGDPGSGANDTSTLTNPPAHIYNSSGTYTVTLIGTTGSCTDSYTANFYLVPETASFTMTDDTICFGDSAHFSNTSTPLATFVVWNFGDIGSGSNNTSTLMNPAHLYSDTGMFIVTLTAYNAYCNQTIRDTIYVRPNPVVTFSNTDSTHCEPPWPVTFTGTGSNIASWYWIFGDGSTGTSTLPAITHTYNNYGIDTVYLIATDIYGCKSDTVIHYSDVQIIAPSITIISTQDSGCNPLTTTITAIANLGPGDAIATVTWHFGDGTPDSICTCLTATHTYTYTTPPGIYDVIVTMTTTDGCVVSDTSVGLIRVGNHVSVNFDHDPDTVCYGDTIHFWSTTPQGDPPISSYTWSFGGNDSSIWVSTEGWDTGWVQVQLICHCNGCGSGYNYVDSVYILAPKPIIAQFQYDCNDRYTIHFQSLSQGADSIVWNFGDGTMDTTNNPNPIHVFPDNQDYTVTLTAFNGPTACSFSTSVLIQIRDAQAYPSATPVVGCFPLKPFFVGSTSQDAIRWRWNFDDPSSGQLDTNYYSVLPWYTDTFHLYNNTGIYNARLIVTDIHSCVDTEYVQIQVNGPDAIFSSIDSVGCMPFNAPFDASASTVFPAGGNITSYFWNFSYPGNTDTATTTTASTSHLYTSSGQFTVQLILTDNNGCHDTAYHSSFIQVMHPYPSLTIDTFLCTNTSANFTGNISDIPGSANYTFIWDFGDGSPLVTNSNSSSPNNTVSHSYSVNNTVNVLTLIVEDREGCRDTIARNITVLNPVPAFTVTASDSCGYTHVQYSSPDTTNNYQWQWSITGPAGYASSSVFQNPFFNYTVNGTYNTTLTVTNPGCSATTQLSGIVVSHPEAYFDYVPQTHCPPVQITFTSHLTNGIPYVFIQWAPGDGSIHNTYYPDSTFTYTYYNPGSYNPEASIAYILSNGDTCLYTDRDTVNVSIVVTPGPTVNITNTSPIMLMQGEIDTLTSTITGATTGPYTYVWNVVPGPETLPPYNTTGAIYTADTTDDFIVIVLTDANGCQDWDTLDLEIMRCSNNLIIPNVFTPNGDRLNDTYYIGREGIDCPIYDFDIKIFNRWGNVVYENSVSAGVDFAWDGKDDNGKDCSEGTYYYVMKYMLSKKMNKLNGYIQLIRD